MTRKTFLQFTPSLGNIAYAFAAMALISAPLFAQADPYPSSQQQQDWQQQNPNQQDRQLENPPRERTQSPSSQLEYCAEAQNAGLPECRAAFSAPYPEQARRPDRSSQQQPEYKASEPPTEFQRYILTSSGERLPIYGAPGCSNTCQLRLRRWIRCR